LSKLSEILADRPVNQSDLSRILSLLLTTELGYAESVGPLFHLIGSSFALMVMPIIAGLEVVSTNNDWRTRAVCTSAITQLILENQAKITKEDRFITMWNLYFALTSIQSVSQTFPDRIVVLMNLKKLAPLFRLENEEFCSEVVSTLLRLSSKTVMEIQTIKDILTLIFEGAMEKTVESKRKPTDTYFGVFIELISSQDENAFDLLSWALEQFFTIENKRTKGKAFKTSLSQLPTSDTEVVTHDGLQDFSFLLSNHFRAPNPLIRYAAALTLHAIVNLCPSFPSMSAHIWPFIVSGVLDSDHATSAVYVSIIEALKLPDIQAIKSFIKSFIRRGALDLSYDEIYVQERPVPDQSNISTFLDMLVKGAPPIHISVLHKMAHSLEFIPPKQKVLQLEQIRVWGMKSKNLDTYLMKMLVPFCTSHDDKVQLTAIRVVDQLLPGYQQATPADVAFLWKYVGSLLNINLDSKIITAAIKLLHSFPLGPLTGPLREELVTKLFFIIFHKIPNVRMAVYDYFFKTCEFWKSNGLLHHILGVLFVSLGDSEIKNVKELVDMLTTMGGAFFGPLSTQLGKLRDAQHLTSLGMMKLYDQLITALAVAKLEMKSLVETFSIPYRVDSFWQYFMHKVPENQLVRPEEYDYTRNYVHNPIFSALLFTKFSVPPPPLGDGTRRDQVPTTPMGKRRFLCGLMQTLFPSCGSWEPAVRRTACVAVVSCCFKGFNAQADMLKALLEYVSQLFLTSKYGSYQMAALEIFGTIVRLKVPGVAEAIFNQYYDICLEFLHNTHSPMIATSVMRLIEIFLLVFPKGMNPRLTEIRDVTRNLLVHKDSDVRGQATKVFPLVFKAAEGHLTVEFDEYLKNEINLLQNLDSPEAKADPMIAQLTPNLVEDILVLDILSLGLLSGLPQGTFPNAQFLIPFLVKNNPACRYNALSAIFTMISGMNPADAATMVWITLPLYVDPNYQIRLLWSRFIRNIPNMINSRCSALMSHPDDAVTLPSEAWEDVLAEQSTLMVNSKCLADLGFEIDQLVSLNVNELPVEDDGFHLPTISEKLMSRIRELVQTMAGPLPISAQHLVKYHFQMFVDSTLHSPAAMLLLSEFGCLHDDSFNDTTQVLLTNLTLDLDAFTWPIIEASILGIGNVLLNSRPMLKQIIEELTLNSGLSEGELSALVYLFEKLNNLSSAAITDLMERAKTIVTNSRHTVDKRLLAARLASDCALRLEPDSIRSVLDSLQTFLETINHNQNDTKEKIFKIAGKLLTVGGDKHLLFRSMAIQSKKNWTSKQPEVRLQALSIFRIYAKILSREEFIGSLFRFLADSDPAIREAARNMIIEDNLLDFAMAELDKIRPEIGKRDELLTSCKLPCMDTVGILINHRTIQDGTSHDNTAFADPFNIQFYRSDRRRKFSDLYGINESTFAKATELLTLGVRKKIQVLVMGLSLEEQALYFSESKLHALRPMQILQVLIPFVPVVAEGIVNELLVNLEDTINSKNDGDEESKDVEYMAHKLDVLSNLILAHGIKSDNVPKWLGRLRKFIETCCSTSNKLRESLYHELEHSFYFCSQYADIPLLSEEQINDIQELRDLAQEAILDIVKSGKTEKMTLIENRNDQWDGAVDSESDYLRRLTILSLHVLSGLGIYFTLTKEVPEDKLIEALEFLVPLMDEEHRGMRLVVIDCFVYMISLLDKFNQKEKLYNFVRSTFQQLLQKVETNYNQLYRRKADYASLLAQVSVHFSDREMHAQLLKLLLKMWRDADSEVRQVSINMIQVILTNVASRRNWSRLCFGSFPN
jgi:hypothetical protein